MYRAFIEIPCEDVEIIKKVLEPEAKGDEFKGVIEEGDGKIIIKIEAKRLSMLQAGINSYLRLIKTIYFNESNK